MRNFTFKGLFLTAVFMLLGCLSIQAANEDLITKQITIKLDEAGTLPNKIASSEMYKITNLKITGEINGTDWKMIREMAGSNYKGEPTEGMLSVLDLSEAKIVAGGDYYYNDGDEYNNTSNDVIGEFAFYGCSGLTSLTLPSSITEIGTCAFYGCSGLTSLNLPDGITSIGWCAFKGCSGLTSLTLPDGITSIGGYAFDGCSGLTSLTLPDGITSIGKSAFEGCSGLTSLTLPAGITSIGGFTFYGCSGLTSLTLHDGITSIGEGEFSGCSGLTSLTLPSSISEIGDVAFFGCSGLTSLTLHDGITSIGEGAFSECTGLKEVRFCINDNLDTYLTKGHPYIYVNCDIKYYINDKEITSIEIPSNVTSLGQNVFQKCSGLTSLTLPSSITEICSYAFAGCSGLTSLTLPDGITSIGRSAFTSCSGLTSLTLPDGITSISKFAFYGCSGLTSLTLPAGITSIGSYAFYGCSGLTSIYVYAEKVPKIGEDVFKGCEAKKCILYVPKGTYDDYWLSDFGYFENIVEFDATGIDKTKTSTDAKELSHYSVNGQRLVGPTKGLNIVKYSDGSVKKVAVE